MVRGQRRLHSAGSPAPLRRHRRGDLRSGSLPTDHARQAFRPRSGHHPPPRPARKNTLSTGSPGPDPVERTGNGLQLNAEEMLSGVTVPLSSVVWGGRRRRLGQAAQRLRHEVPPASVRRSVPRCEHLRSRRQPARHSPPTVRSRAQKGLMKPASRPSRKAPAVVTCSEVPKRLAKPRAPCPTTRNAGPRTALDAPPAWLPTRGPAGAPPRGGTQWRCIPARPPYPLT